MEKYQYRLKIAGIIAAAAITLALIAAIAFESYTENQRNSVAANRPLQIECGSCGAHVSDYWYVENLNSGEPVEVCEFCYNNYIENTATEN